jgi:NAD(P)H dehydrogenase (quinone)
MGKILVTGATGPLGAGVIKHLSGADVRSLVRKPTAGLPDPVVGDYDDYASLLRAMEGVASVFLVSGNDIANRGRQHLNVIKAAVASGVKHIVYTSLQRKDESPSSPVADKTIAHLETEAALLASGLSYTILRYALYAEIIPIFAGPVLETRTICLRAGDGKVAYALRDDLAEAGAKVLLDRSYDNQILEITGPVALSWREIAAMISPEISYVSPSVADFKAASAGLPAVVVEAIAGMQQAVAAGEYEHVTTLLEEILGRKPGTVAEYLHTVYSV